MVGTILDIVLWLLSSNVATVEAEDKSEDHNEKDNSKEISITKESTKPCNNHPNAKNFILAFSLCTTFPNLLMRQPPSALKSLGGIKIISTLVIITLHVQQFALNFFPAISQNSYLQQLASRLIFQPMMSVTFAIEIFFVVSGTLSAYLTLKDIEKHKRFRLNYFYLNRFFRLSPLLYFYTLIAYKLSAQFGQGPLWYSIDANACVNTWWYILLYLGNTSYMQSNINGMITCLGMTWHVSADMQLFIVSPIFIVLLYYFEYIGLAVVAIAMIGTTAIVGYVAATNGHWAAMFYNPQVIQQVTGFYNQAFNRFNGYMTGILLGYILYKKYNIATLPIRNFSKQLIYTLLWVVGIMLCLVTMFGTYPVYGFAYHFSDFENVTFLMFSGLAWSIGIAIIIYICNTGYGGMVNSFLSLPGWEPLVKLNYGVTLCHVMMMFCIVGTLQGGLKYTDTVFAMILVFTLVLSYSFSAITAVFVEQPISKVVSLCFKLAGVEGRSK